MLTTRRTVAAFGVCAAAVLGTSGAAWASAGGSPAPQANCLGQANSGGANGAFIQPIATSGPGILGAGVRIFGTSGGAGLPASNNNCSLS